MSPVSLFVTDVPDLFVSDVPGSHPRFPAAGLPVEDLDRKPTIPDQHVADLVNHRASGCPISVRIPRSASPQTFDFALLTHDSRYRLHLGVIPSGATTFLSLFCWPADVTYSGAMRLCSALCSAPLDLFNECLNLESTEASFRLTRKVSVDRALPVWL